jgi:MFS family permease
MFFLAQAFSSPWMAVFWINNGLSPLDIAWLNAAQPVVSLVAAPGMGYLADRTGHHKLIQLVGWILYSCSIVALPYVTSFWPLLLLCCFRALTSASMIPLVNHSVIDLLGPSGKEQFGQQRMYGAVTWGLGSPLAGLVIVTPTLGFEAACWMSVGLQVPAMACAQWLFHAAKAAVQARGEEATLSEQVGAELVPVAASQTSSSEDAASVGRGGPTKLTGSSGVEGQDSDAKRDERCCSEIRLVLTKPEALLFFFATLVMGSTFAFITIYLFIFLQELGANEILMGLCLTFTCISEVPIMFLSGYFIRCCGVRVMYSMVMACYIVRLLIYSVLEDPWLVLPVELIHGITFGVMYTAGTQYAAMLGEEYGVGATMQGLFNGVWQFGGSIGALLGGAFYQLTGPRTAFLIFACIMLITLVLYNFNLCISFLACKSDRQAKPAKYGHRQLT